jgi:hypothetical protein
MAKMRFQTKKFIGAAPIPPAAPLTAPGPAVGGFYTQPEDLIDYKFSSTSSLIDYACFSELVRRYAAAPTTVTYGTYFPKSILLFLLSFEEAAGITMFKCQSPGGAVAAHESIAIYAADENGKPLGWDETVAPPTETHPEKFVGGEWGMSITLSHLAHATKVNSDGATTVDFKVLFDILAEVINKDKE